MLKNISNLEDTSLIHIIPSNTTFIHCSTVIIVQVPSYSFPIVKAQPNIIYLSLLFEQKQQN